MTGPTILLIDDDVTLLELLLAHLQTAGYRPVTASDGRAACAWRSGRVLTSWCWM
jgi:DNA-binding response OmpR family regulator